MIDKLISDIHEKGTCVRVISGKRETWRVAALDGAYYVKIFYQKGLFRRLLSLLNISKTDKEIKAFQMLKGLDVLVPDLVAHKSIGGILLSEKDYIVTKEVEGSKRLIDFYLNDFFALSRKDQKILIHDFSRYIRNLHDKGIIHTDPCLGNFLIRQEAGANRFYLLDLADVKINSSLSFNDRLINLSFLNLNFLKSVPVSLRYYFFKTYFKGMFKTKTEITNAINKIEYMTIELAKKTWDKRIYRCLVNNSFFDSIKKASVKIHFKRKWKDNEGFKRLLDFPDQYLDEGKGEVLKDGRTVKATVVDIGSDKMLFLKRFNRKGFLHTVKNIFRSSRAKRIWINSYGFELRGIPIPQPVAYMEERRFRILKRSYVISEFIQDAHTLRSLFSYNLIPTEERLSVMQLVGREIGKMHKLGCIHGDIKWSNILIKIIDGKYRCFFVDLDGSEIKRRLSLSKIVDELSRFYVEMLKYKINSAEQEAFLRGYFNQNQLRVCRKELLKRIKEKALSKFESYKLKN